jgi:hypothetical protein
MSRLNLTKITTPLVPPTGMGTIHYNSTLGTDEVAFLDDSGVLTRMAQNSVKITADLAGVTSTTNVNATGLAFTGIVSGQWYFIRWGILWTTATATTGIKLEMTGTFGGGGFLPLLVHIPVAADGTAAEHTGILNTSGDQVVGTGAEATGTVYLAMIEGPVLAGGTSNFQIQYGAEVAAAGAVTIKQGSFGMLWEI